MIRLKQITVFYCVLFSCFSSPRAHAQDFTECIRGLLKKGSPVSAKAPSPDYRVRLNLMGLEDRLTPVAPGSPLSVSSELITPTTANVYWADNYGDPATDEDDPYAVEVYANGEYQGEVTAGEGYSTLYDLPTESQITVSLYAYNADGTSYPSTTIFYTGSLVYPPQAPSNLTINAGSNDATISWNGDSAADHYEVNLNGNTYDTYNRSIYFSNLEPNSDYFVQVTAVNSAGSASSEGTVFTTAPLPIPVPTQPTLYGSNFTADSITVSVSGGVGADYFTLERTNPDGSVTYLTDLYPGESLYYIDKGLNEFSNYGYTVTAINEGYEIKASGTFATGYKPFLDLTQSPHVIVAAAAEGSSLVQVYDSSTKRLVGRFEPYPGFGGGAYVAVADVDGDGVSDIITGAGKGGGPHVRVFSGKGLKEIYSFMAYATNFSGGVRVAAADINGDGYAEIITAAGPGGGPHVKVFDGRTGEATASFYAFAPIFAGGVEVSAGDFDGDGKAEVIVGAGAGGGPHTRVLKITGGEVTSLFETFPYSPKFGGGVFVAAGDLNNDGKTELIAGAGAGGGPHLVAIDVQRPENYYSSFYAADSSSGTGISVGFTKINGKAALISAQGKGGLAKVSVFKTDGELLFDLDLGLPSLNGVYVGGN